MIKPERKRGRKPKPASTPVNFRLRVDVLEVVKRLSAQQYRTLTGYFERAIMRALQADGIDTAQFLDTDE